MPSEMTARDLCHDNFVKGLANEPVSKLVGQFLEKNQNHALVFQENNAYLGITTKEGFWQKHLDFTTLKQKSLVQGKPVLYADDPLHTIAELMFSSEARVLPVFENSKMIGVVTARDVIFELEKNPALANRLVREIASPVLVVAETDPIEKAISILRNKKINRIPVVSKNGELAGLFSFSDFLRNLPRIQPRRPKGKPGESKERSSVRILDLPVKDFAFSNPETIRPGDRIATALQKMRQKNISSLIVTEKSRPAGIITVRDLLKLLVQSKQAPATTKIQVSGKPELDEIDSATLDKKISDFAERFSRRFSPDFSLSIHFKEESATGIRKKYSVKAHLTGSGYDFVAKAQEWDAVKATQDAFKILVSEAERKKR